MTLICALCQATTWLMFHIAGSKRTGALPCVLCQPCWRRYRDYEVDLPGGEAE